MKLNMLCIKFHKQNIKNLETYKIWTFEFVLKTLKPRFLEPFGWEFSQKKTAAYLYGNV